jgi:hypothetical protein
MASFASDSCRQTELISTQNDKNSACVHALHACMRTEQKSANNAAEHQAAAIGEGRGRDLDQVRVEFGREQSRNGFTIL